MLDPTGAIAIELKCRPGEPRFTATLANTRPTGVINTLASKGTDTARLLITSLYALCPIAHLVAFDACRRAARGLSEIERRQLEACLSERAVALEGAVETVRVLMTEGLSIIDEKAPREVMLELGRLRALLAELARVIVKRGGETAPSGIDPDAAHGLIDKALPMLTDLVEKHVTGLPAGCFADTLSTASGFEAWTRGGETGPARLLRALDQLPASFGRCPTPLLPRPDDMESKFFADELYWRLRNEAGFEKVPVWKGGPRLTGALVTEHAHPLLADRIEAGRFGPAELVLARLLKLERTMRCLKEGCPTEGGLEHVLTLDPEPERSGGVALVWTARGVLAYMTTSKPPAGAPVPDEGANEAKSAPFYAAVSPTEWQFTPGGAAEAALNAALATTSRKAACAHAEPPTTEALERVVRTALFGLDACVPLRISVRTTP